MKFSHSYASLPGAHLVENPIIVQCSIKYTIRTHTISGFEKKKKLKK